MKLKCHGDGVKDYPCLIWCCKGLWKPTCMAYQITLITGESTCLSLFPIHPLSLPLVMMPPYAHGISLHSNKFTLLKATRITCALASWVRAVRIFFSQVRKLSLRSAWREAAYAATNNEYFAPTTLPFPFSESFLFFFNDIRLLWSYCAPLGYTHQGQCVSSRSWLPCRGCTHVFIWYRFSFRRWVCSFLIAALLYLCMYVCVCVFVFVFMCTCRCPAHIVSIIVVVVVTII